MRDVRDAQAGLGGCLHALVDDWVVALELEEDGERWPTNSSADDADFHWRHCVNLI